MDKRKKRQLGIIAHSFVFTTIENRARAHIRSGRVDARTRSTVEILHAVNLHKASLKRWHKDGGRKEMPIDLPQPTLFSRLVLNIHKTMICGLLPTPTPPPCHTAGHVPLSDSFSLSVSFYLRFPSAIFVNDRSSSRKCVA